MADERNHQVFNFVDIVKGIMPKAFVMENVRGITQTGQKDKNSIINQLIGKFSKLGYKAVWRVLSADEYGVPQKRRRLFLVGVRKELKHFEFPLPTHSDKEDLFINLKPLVTVREAIDDLPSPNNGSLLSYDKKISSNYQKLMRLNSEGVDAHSITKHSPEFVEKLKAQGLGEKLYPKWNHSWVKFHPDKVAPTIKENHRAPGVHYERPMCISPRECARLQSMPDRFFLLGNKTERLVQVGNAVPPFLAAAVARSIAEAMSDEGIRI
jgi:DNA (cytosine-5)-methyltransferase 1